jgi:hypothetical protein
MERETGIEPIGSTASAPSAWECERGRETAPAFVSGVKIGVFKRR